MAVVVDKSTTQETANTTALEVVLLDRETTAAKAAETKARAIKEATSSSNSTSSTCTRSPTVAEVEAAVNSFNNNI